MHMYMQMYVYVYVHSMAFSDDKQIDPFRHGVITPECPNYLALVHSLRGTLDSINSH